MTVSVLTRREVWRLRRLADRLMTQISWTAIAAEVAVQRVR